MSTYAAQKMHSAASDIYEHPYTVSNTAREMRSRLLDMKQFIGIILTSKFTSVGDTELLLDERYTLQQESADVMRERYLGPQAEIDALQDAMDALIEHQALAVQYATQHTDAETFEYIQSELYSYYDDVSGCLGAIIAFADHKVQSLERQSQLMSYVEISAAVVLAVIIIGMTVHTNRLLERRRRRDVAYREKLFDLLAENVDDVFFIYNLQNRDLEYISSNCERIFGLREEQFYDHHVFRPMISEADAVRLDELFDGGVLHT